MSRGPIHVLNFFRPREPPLRVSLHSASAWAPFRPIEMSRQRRVRGAVDALAWNAAHSHRIWRHQEVALLGFEQGPVPMAHTGRLQEIRLPGGRQVWPGKCVRNVAERTLPAVCSYSTSSLVSHRMEFLKYSQGGLPNWSQLSGRCTATSLEQMVVEQSLPGLEKTAGTCSFGL
jgi:hypothetical protein